VAQELRKSAVKKHAKWIEQSLARCQNECAFCA
jgi:hypothetical protein